MQLSRAKAGNPASCSIIKDKYEPTSKFLVQVCEMDTQFF